MMQRVRLVLAGITLVLSAVAATMSGCGGSKTLHFLGAGGNGSGGDGTGGGGGSPPGCGDGAKSASEECDDGNTDDGDGCSRQCTIEGSCTAPQVIALTADADGVKGNATGTTSDNDVKQVDPGDCQGATVGAGSDRVFQVDLTQPADLEVRVGSNFDAIVRVLTSPCTLTDQVYCSDAVAVAEVEDVVLPNTPAGTYYIVVDGKGAGQAGTFSVEVQARCPLENVKIDRVILLAPFRTQLVNYNPTCQVDLSRVGFFAQPIGTGSPTALPERMLPALGRVELTSDNPPAQGSIYQGTIPFDTQNYAGAVYLCRGVCNQSTGANVYDALRWEGGSGPLPGGLAAPTQVQFDTELPALTNRTTQSYYRVLRESAFPDFKSTDFVPAFYVETFEDKDVAWADPPTLFYAQSYDNPTGTIGNFALKLDGGNASTAVWNGAKYPFVDNAGVAVPLAPSYVSLFARVAEAAKNAGWIFFGSSGAEANLFGSEFRTNNTLAFGSPAVAFFTNYAPNTWYHIEYTNFNYAQRTVEVLLNGVSQGTLTMTDANARQLNIRSIDATQIWVDQIIVQ